MGYQQFLDHKAQLGGQHGFTPIRYCIWKEPLGVRNRTMAKNLAHKTVVDDSSRCGVASADYLLVFRRNGENPIPIAHPVGLLDYAGKRTPPAKVLAYRPKPKSAPAKKRAKRRKNAART